MVCARLRFVTEAQPEIVVAFSGLRCNYVTQVAQGLEVWCVDAGASGSQASCMRQVVCGSITKKVPVLWDLLSLIDVVKMSFGLRGTVQLTATDGKEQCLMLSARSMARDSCPA